MKLQFCFITALLMATVMAAGGCADGGGLDSRRRAAIDSVFDAVYSDPDGPGAAVLIARGGEVIYERCFGLADLATRQPVTDSTNFCIASVSKQFAAVALLQLAERRVESRG